MVFCARLEVDALLPTPEAPRGEERVIDGPIRPQLTGIGAAPPEGVPV